MYRMSDLESFGVAYLIVDHCLCEMGKEVVISEEVSGKGEMIREIEIEEEVQAGLL